MNYYVEQRQTSIPKIRIQQFLLVQCCILILVFANFKEKTYIHQSGYRMQKIVFKKKGAGMGGITGNYLELYFEIDVKYWHSSFRLKKVAR